MKIARTYTLDVEIVNKLKQEENASALIEQLLINHYETKKKRSKDEIRRQLEIAKIELETAKRIKEVENGIIN